MPTYGHLLLHAYVNYLRYDKINFTLNLVAKLLYGQRICKTFIIRASIIMHQLQYSSLNDLKLKCYCLQLKHVCQYIDGKRVEINPSQSAEIIHKIGMLHFTQNQDKTTLVKSVGLLNVAIARNPNNISEIQRDLSEVCQQILKQANARDQGAKLTGQANLVKIQIEKMREKTNTVLEELKNVEKFEKEKKTEFVPPTKVQNYINKKHPTPSHTLHKNHERFMRILHRCVRFSTL